MSISSWWSLARLFDICSSVDGPNQRHCRLWVSSENESRARLQSESLLLRSQNLSIVRPAKKTVQSHQRSGRQKTCSVSPTQRRVQPRTPKLRKIWIGHYIYIYIHIHVYCRASHTGDAIRVMCCCCCCCWHEELLDLLRSKAVDFNVPDSWGTQGKPRVWPRWWVQSLFPVLLKKNTLGWWWWWWWWCWWWWWWSQVPDSVGTGWNLQLDSFGSLVPGYRWKCWDRQLKQQHSNWIH